MKKLFTLLALAITIGATAQAPQGFNYQATVRNSAGALIVNQNVYFKFNVMLNSQTSVPVYSETHFAPTDDLGQVNLVIGTGTPAIGTFSSINWSSGTYYLGIELNTGSGYVVMGTTQLLSVPYALYANTAGNSQATTPNLADVLAVNNGANNLQIKNLSDPTDAQDAVTKSYSDLQLQTQIATLQTQITALVNATAAPLPNVTIGAQIWQNSNLDVTTYRDGTLIPQVTDPTAWANLTTGAWCYYNNDPSNGPIYGKLYNWYAVAGIHNTESLNDVSLRKQLSPTGWHVPTDSEWITLINFLDPNADGGINMNIAGGKMKETGTSHWQSPNLGATNESGFTGLPGGFRNFYEGSFFIIGTLGGWWSSSENETMDASGRCLNNNGGNTSIGGGNKKCGFSVRCLRDSYGNSNTIVVPVSPTNLTGAIVSPTEITLQWNDNSTNETGFVIERKIGNGNYTPVGNTLADIATFSDTGGLTPSTQYTYRVYSANGFGNSLTYTNELTLVTGP